MESPTQRSLRLLRKEGYSAQVVERYNQYARVRIDLFGFIDVVAMGNGEIIGVQSTSQGNITARIKKILGIPEAKIWLENGGKIVVHGWGKKGKEGKRKLWICDIRKVILEDFPSP